MKQIKTKEEILRETITATNGECSDNTFNIILNLHPYIIPAMQTFAQQDKWIKYPENTPELNTHNQSEYMLCMYQDSAPFVAFYDDETKSWFLSTGKIDGILKVTHYQSVPPPPNSTPST